MGRRTCHLRAPIPAPCGGEVQTDPVTLTAPVQIAKPALDPSGRMPALAWPTANTAASRSRSRDQSTRGREGSTLAGASAGVQRQCLALDLTQTDSLATLILQIRPPRLGGLDVPFLRPSLQVSPCLCAYLSRCIFTFTFVNTCGRACMCVVSILQLGQEFT